MLRQTADDRKRLNGTVSIKRVQMRYKNRQFVHFGVWVLFAAYLTFTVINQLPWFPSENITSANAAPFSGYVIGETDTDVTILTLNTRQNSSFEAR